MRPFFLIIASLSIACLAEERRVVLLDEDGRGLQGAMVEVVLTPPDDPRLAGVISLSGLTDAGGTYRYEAGERMILSRMQAKLSGHHAVDADQRHGLGRPGRTTTTTFTMPRVTELVPLHYREVRLTRLPADRWIGFDAAMGDAVAPWGKGQSADLRFHLSFKQTGWTESAEALAMLRRTPEGRRMDEEEWSETYGRFEGSLRLSFPRPGDGIVASSGFWPYCLLKMPASAPSDGFLDEQEIRFDTLTNMTTSPDSRGSFLRVRTQRDASGRITSAHYAKIHGRIEAGPGRVAFRFYYNPRADDRRLAFAPGRNLLRPGPGEPNHAFETQQP